jgi:hypothetical protein
MSHVSSVNGSPFSVLYQVTQGDDVADIFSLQQGGFYVSLSG